MKKADDVAKKNEGADFREVGERHFRGIL